MNARAIARMIVFLVVALFTLNACGGGPEVVDVIIEDAGGPSELPAPSPDRVAAVPALLAEAAEQELTGVEVTMTMEMGGFEEFGGETIGFSALMATSADGRRSRMVMDMTDLIEASAVAAGEELPPELDGFLGEPIEVREIDGTGYVSSGFVSWLFPVDTAWLSYPVEGGSSGLDTDMADASAFLEVLDAVGSDVDVVGTEEIDGVATTHVRGRLTAESLAATGDDDFLSGLDMTDAGVLDITALDVDVWLLENGEVRRLAMGLDDIAAIDPTAPAGSYFRFTIDIRELDGALDVDAPPASDVTPMGGAFGFGD